MEGKILYKDLSYKLVGCFYKAYNILGPGHKEDIYHRALKIEFDAQKIDYLVYTEKPPFLCHCEGAKRPKQSQKRDCFAPPGLAMTGFSALTKLGYLINFGSDKIDIRRRILPHPKFAKHEKPNRTFALPF